MHSPSRFLFDWRNPIGYLIAVTIQYIQASYLFLFAATMVSAGIGYYLLGMAIATEIKVGLNSMSESAKLDENQLQMIEQLRDIVEIHSFLYELSELYSPFFVSFDSILAGKLLFLFSEFSVDSLT